METTSKKPKNLFLSGVLVLTFSNILVKIIGLTLKIPLHHILGDEGMGYYNVAYDIYVWLYMISTAGLPVAISIMTAESRTKGNIREVKRIFKITLTLFLIIGLVGMLIMLLGSQAFASAYKLDSSYLCIIAIAPTLFFICVSSAINGFFQGYQNLFPTAVSQIIEALGKLIIGICLALYAVKSGFSLPTVAAYTILGLTIGVAASMLFLTISKLTFKESVFNERLNTPGDPTLEPRPVKVLLKALITIAIPVTLSSSVMSLTNVVDGIIISRQLQSLGYTEEVASALFGNYKTLAVSLFNMPPALIYPISYAIIPLLSSVLATGDKEKTHKIMSSAMRVVALISLPCSLGLSVLAEPILKLLFDDKSAERAAPLLSILSLAILFLAMLNLTNAILQTHKHERKPIISVIVGSAVKLAASYFLIGHPAIQMFGAPISTALCYLSAMLLNLYFLSRYVGFTPSVVGIFVRPLLSAGLCALAAIGSYKLISSFISSSITVIAAIGVAMVVYILAIFLFKAVTKDDILLLPKGQKICSVLTRIGFIKENA